MNILIINLFTIQVELEYEHFHILVLQRDQKSFYRTLEWRFKASHKDCQSKELFQMGD